MLCSPMSWHRSMIGLQVVALHLLACSADKQPDVSLPEVGKSVAASPAIFEAQLYAGEVPLKVLPLSMRIETSGGGSTVLIPAGTTLPAEHRESFSTASDNQSSVQIHVLQGERSLVADNRQVAKVTLSGILPAPRGVPLIDVRFTIDASGHFSISATDRASQEPRPVSVLNEAAEPLGQAEIEALRQPAAPSQSPTRMRLFAEGLAEHRLPLSLGIETLWGRNSIVIPRDTELPHVFREVFSTSTDNQARVEVHLVQGERVMASDNRTLAVFRLEGINPAPRAMPRIELTLSIDESGEMSASAVNLDTGLKREITVSDATKGGLTEDTVKDMLSTAEAAKAIDARLGNILDRLDKLAALVQGAGALAEHPDISKLSAQTIKQAIANAQSVLTLGPRALDFGDLERTTEKLEKVSHEASTKLYK